MVDLTKPRRSSITVIPMKAANFELVGPSEKRRAIRITTSLNASNMGVNNRPMANADDGSWVNTDINQYGLRYEDFGDLVCGPWYGFGFSAIGSAVVIEALEI